MAQEDDLDLDTEGVAEAPKSKSKLIIIIVAVVLLLGVSGAATLMLTGVLSGDEPAMDEQAQAGKGKDARAKETAKARAPLNYVPMDPPFVVNFSGDTDIRFLQVTIEVGTRDPDMVELVKEQRPAIRNNLVMLFSNQDPYTLNTREGKEKLRSEALGEIQKVMKQETGRAGVESVFFTSFVMQ
jgi:flagellar FliL protein